VIFTRRRITLPGAQMVSHVLRRDTAQEATMPKGFNLRCAAGKTARVWPQGKGGALTPGQALVLLPLQNGDIDDSPVAYRAPLRQALIDDNTGHVNIVVCET
jgi:hypothetical protein